MTTKSPECVRQKVLHPTVLEVPQLSRSGLSSADVIAVRRIVALGLLDQVARWATAFQSRSAGYPPVVDGKTANVAFFDILRKDIVFIHPNSTVL